MTHQALALLALVDPPLARSVLQAGDGLVAADQARVPALRTAAGRLTGQVRAVPALQAAALGPARLAAAHQAVLLPAAARSQHHPVHHTVCSGPQYSSGGHWACLTCGASGGWEVGGAGAAVATRSVDAGGAGVAGVTPRLALVNIPTLQPRPAPRPVASVAGAAGAVVPAHPVDTDGGRRAVVQPRLALVHILLAVRPSKARGTETAAGCGAGATVLTVRQAGGGALNPVPRVAGQAAAIVPARPGVVAAGESVAGPLPPPAGVHRQAGGVGGVQAVTCLAPAGVAAHEVYALSPLQCAVVAGRSARHQTLVNIITFSSVPLKPN